jgi:multidrug resistance protein
MVSTIMAPALNTIAKEFNMNNTESSMALSIYLLATAFGPLVIGPMSEIYGRGPVLHASNIWFLIWNIVCGFANTKEVLIASRFLAGFGASAIYALAGGVLGDVWRPEERGRSISVYILIPLLAVAVGPIIGGFMAARATWRWMFWSTSIFQVVMIAMSFATFRETYPPTILHRRATKLRKSTGNQSYYTLFDRLSADDSLPKRLWINLSRPMRLLFFHPIIQFISVLEGMTYGLLYIVLSTFSDLWTTQYGQSVEISGLHYIAIALGELLGSQVGGRLMDKLFAYLKHRAHGEITPEFHIPLMLPGCLLSAAGLVLYGWAAQYHLHWAVVDFGALLFAFGSQISGQPKQAYVIDSYPEYTSSATAASQFVRSMTAFTFPLFAWKMYAAMGYGWGNTMLGGVLAVVGGGGCWGIWTWGARLREKSMRDGLR